MSLGTANISVTATDGVSSEPLLVQVPPEFVALEQQFLAGKTRIGDIHEHMDTLYAYATEVESIIECGVETAVSSWAFVKGLYDNEKSRKRLLSIDLNYHPNIAQVRNIATKLGIDYEFKRGSDLCVEVEETDLTFIDTWHIYGHLKRELARFAPLTRKYIILHDTVVDGEVGETIRRGWNPLAQAQESGYPVGDIIRGLKDAVSEFLANNAEWRQRDHFSNCNGLTILERVASDLDRKRELASKIAVLHRQYVSNLINDVNPTDDVLSKIQPALVRMADELNSDRYSIRELKLLDTILSNPEWLALSTKFGTDCIRITTDVVKAENASNLLKAVTREALSAIRDTESYTVIKVEGDDYVATKLEGDAV